MAINLTLHWWGAGQCLSNCQNKILPKIGTQKWLGNRRFQTDETNLFKFQLLILHTFLTVIRYKDMN